MHQTLTGTKKKQKKTKSQHLLTILDPPCLPMFCEIVLCFFVFSCLPMFFEHHYKTKCKKMRLGFRAIRCRKHRYLQCFVFIFIQKLRPWSPALKKKWVTTFVVLGGVVQIYAQHVSVYIPRFHLK